MKKIGITGGIGSGKSTVCEIFKLLGVPVFHADIEAKILQNNDLNIKILLVNLLGDDIYTPDGILDRKKMARVIFNDPKLLAAVNGIIHPAVRKCFQNWCGNYQLMPYVLYEAAILFESGYASDFDRNILIIADEKSRIERVIKRDKTTEDIIEQRIKNQMTDIEKAKKADYIIENNNQCLIIPQIIKLDKLIREDGKNW